MTQFLPDIGGLMATVAMLLTVAIMAMEARERRREERILDAIDREFTAWSKSGRL